MRTDRNGFWREALAIHGSTIPYVLPYVLAFGLVAAVVDGLSWAIERTFQVQIAIEVAPYEVAGAVLGLLLVVRTNAGYDRWWEARKLWGGIVNQSRNLVISVLSYGPADATWRDRFVRWAAAFPHVARCSLRGEPPPPEVAALIGPDDADRVAKAEHMPSLVAMTLADLLRAACDQFQMDRFGFLQVDRERALLIDHVGGCERIVKTPLPLVYAIEVRRFIALFLLTLPFALLHKIENLWLVPLITMLVAYPLISLDQIGAELQNPFARCNISHLPLDDIAATIERNLKGLLSAKQGTAGSAKPEPDRQVIEPARSGR
jgi:putative membrane protein